MQIVQIDSQIVFHSSKDNRDSGQHPLPSVHNLQLQVCYSAYTHSGFLLCFASCWAVLCPAECCGTWLTYKFGAFRTQPGQLYLEQTEFSSMLLVEPAVWRLNLSEQEEAELRASTLLVEAALMLAEPHPAFSAFCCADKYYKRTISKEIL